MSETCPSCGVPGNMTLEITGVRFMNDGPAFVAGVQEKRQLREVRTAVLACSWCALSVPGYVTGFVHLDEVAQAGYFVPDDPAFHP